MDLQLKLSTVKKLGPMLFSIVGCCVSKVSDIQADNQVTLRLMLYCCNKTNTNITDSSLKPQTLLLGYTEHTDQIDYVIAISNGRVANY